MLQDVPNGAKELIVKMLSIRPEDRPSSYECSRHPYLCGEDY